MGQNKTNKRLSIEMLVMYHKTFATVYMLQIINFVFLLKTLHSSLSC